MKCVVLADVHQAAVKWEQLVQVVQEKKPGLVAIAGDLMPKDRGTLAQGMYMPVLRECAGRIKAAGAELIIIPGNDDNQLMVPGLEQGDADGLWHYVADRVKKVRGYEFCGCPWVRDHPFGYKYWVAAETATDIYIDPFQISPPLLINRHNEIEEIHDYMTYLQGRPSLQELLKKTACQVEDISRSVWLIHQPPVGMGFDICGSGAKVGSTAVYDFLQEKQPLLSVHGHIHEAPAVNGHIWAGRLGDTFCIQAGQPEEELSYVVLEINNGTIEHPAHSLYGRYR